MLSLFGRALLYTPAGPLVLWWARRSFERECFGGRTWVRVTPTMWLDIGPAACGVPAVDSGPPGSPYRLRGASTDTPAVVAPLVNPPPLDEPPQCNCPAYPNCTSRCEGRADGFCKTGNCTAHCREHCGKRCQDTHGPFT